MLILSKIRNFQGITMEFLWNFHQIFIAQRIFNKSADKEPTKNHNLFKNNAIKIKWKLFVREKQKTKTERGKKMNKTMKKKCEKMMKNNE